VAEPDNLLLLLTGLLSIGLLNGPFDLAAGPREFRRRWAARDPIMTRATASREEGAGSGTSTVRLSRVIV
jgi:hypothetical protein